MTRIGTKLAFAQYRHPCACPIIAGGYVYILASKKQGTLYVGVTSDLAYLLEQHRDGNASKFTAKYGCIRLVWCEKHDDIERAITREKTIKKWRRQWKINAIEAINPEWNDLRLVLV